MNFDSFEYWENRHMADPVYFGEKWLGDIKLRANVINEFIKRNDIKRVLDYGCGDGRHSQYIIAEGYLGVEISEIAIRKCRELNPDKSFYLAKKNDKTLRKLLKEFKTELSLSLWTIAHLIEDDIFREYMGNLFCAEKFVIIHEIDESRYMADYQKRRKFTKYIKENFHNWELLGSKKEEYIYGRKRIL